MSAAQNGEPSAPEVLWTPDPERARATAIADFARWVGERQAA